MRIRKSRLLMTFDQLCQELEKRPLREMDVCAFHTRLTNKTAYALSNSKNGLFVVMSQAEAPKHIQLINLKLSGSETAYKAKIHVIHETDVKTMAFITTAFFYEGMKSEEGLADLYSAFPDCDNHRQVVEINSKELDLTGFLT